MPTWPGEAELREFIRRLKDAERRARDLGRAVKALWDLALTLGEVYEGTPAPAPTPTGATIVVQCWSEGGTPYSGVPVSIGGASGTTDANGKFTASGATGVYTVAVAVTGKTGINQSNFYGAGTTTVHVLVYAVATGLTIHDSVLGTVGLTWTSPHWTTSAYRPSVGACPFYGCSAAAAVGVTYQVTNGFWEWWDGTFSNNLALTYTSVSPSNSCPAPWNTGTGQGNPTPTVGTWTFAPSLSLGWSWPGDPLHCAPATVTLTQP